MAEMNLREEIERAYADLSAAYDKAEAYLKAWDAERTKRRALQSAVRKVWMELPREVRDNTIRGQELLELMEEP
jgi:hypothetical protein